MISLVRQFKKIPFSNLAKRCASTFQYVDLQHTEDGYSLLKLNRGPVNSFNLEMANELVEAIDTVEKLPTSRGLIITSAHKVFSAGLDLTELYNPTGDKNREERLRLFWSAFQEVNLRLYRTPLITMAAINGHAPAGGCALSLNCDYRVMVDGKYTIGLNETQVGLTAPYWLCQLFVSVVGYRNAEKFLFLGTLLNPQDALKVGMIDDVVSADELMPTALREMKKWLAVPDVGRTKTKELLRIGYVKEFEKLRGGDLEGFVAVVNNPLLQKTLGGYFKALQSKKK